MKRNIRVTCPKCQGRGQLVYAEPQPVVPLFAPMPEAVRIVTLVCGMCDGAGAVWKRVEVAGYAREDREWT